MKDEVKTTDSTGTTAADVESIAAQTAAQLCTQEGPAKKNVTLRPIVVHASSPEEVKACMGEIVAAIAAGIKEHEAREAEAPEASEGSEEHQGEPDAAQPAETTEAQAKIEQAVELIDKAHELAKEAGGWLYAVAGAGDKSRTTFYGSADDISTAISASMRDSKTARIFMKLAVAKYNILNEE